MTVNFIYPIKPVGSSLRGKGANADANPPLTRQRHQLEMPNGQFFHFLILSLGNMLWVWSASGTTGRGESLEMVLFVKSQPCKSQAACNLVFHPSLKALTWFAINIRSLRVSHHDSEANESSAIITDHLLCIRVFSVTYLTKQQNNLSLIFPLKTTWQWPFFMGGRQCCLQVQVVTEDE